MRLKEFDYNFLSCTIIFYFLIEFVKFNETVTIQERNPKSDDDFSDITVLQSSNQKFTIYRNAVKRECYVEEAPTSKPNPDQQPISRTLFVGKSKITPTHPIYQELGQDVLDSCKNFSIFNLEERPSSVKSSRKKRQVVQQRKPYFKGQTQTQFISFDNEGKNDKGGTAEATAEQDKSTATVQGRMGMGQAQSQSGSGDPCEECSGSVHPTGQFGSAYPSSSYPTGQGGSSQQGVNGPEQYDSGTLYPFGTRYPTGAQSGVSGIPQAGVGGLPTGQNQAGTGGGQPGGGGGPGSQGTGSFHHQSAGFPSSQTGTGGYFRGQPAAPGSGGVPGGIGGFNGGSGQPIGGSQSGGIPQGGFTSGGPTYTPSGGIGSDGTQGSGGRGIVGGTGALPPTGYVPQTDVGLGGGGQGGGALYPPGYVPQSGSGQGGAQGGGGLYTPGYVPQSEAGIGGSQGGATYPLGYVPHSEAPQGGGAYPPGYSPQSGAGRGGQHGGALYPLGYVPTSGAGQGGAPYPPGYFPQSGPSQGGGAHPSGYVPQFGAGTGGSQGGASYPQSVAGQGGASLYPQGYIPQSGAPQGGGGTPYPSGYIPQSGAGSGAQGGVASYPPRYLPQSGSGSGIQGGGTLYPPGYVPQSGVGSGGAQGGGALYPQSSGYTPGSVSQSGVGGLQGGGGIPQGTPQGGTGTAGGTYPHQVSPGYGQPTYYPQGGVFAPQFTPQQEYGPQTGAGGSGYPLQPGYFPQGGAGSLQGGQSISGADTYPQAGTNLVPGGGGGGGGLSPQGGVGTFPNQGSSGQNIGGSTGASFTPQGLPTGQGNVNYIPGSTGYYPLVPTGGTGIPGGQSQTGVGQTQGGGTGIDTSSGLPIDPASGESQSLSSLNIHPNGTKAAASAQGKTRNGMAQVQISGSYTGSFSAQAQTSDNEKSVQAEIYGNTTAASSASQGKAGKSESQSQILYNYNTGATLAESQGSGINYNTNSQIQVGNRGGIADAQSTGSGSTSSQAQIGFLPPDLKRKDQSALFEGGGTSSSQNSASSGQSQTQLQGSFRSGTSFSGSAQSSSGRAQNKTKLGFDPSELSIPFDDPSKPNTEQSAKQVAKKENNIVKSTVPLSSLPQNDHIVSTKNPGPDYESPQHQDAIIKTKNYDAYIERDSSDKSPSLNAGDLVPGTDNYRIPAGFRGRVASTAGDTTQATASSLGNAQSQTVLLKPGKGRVTINDRNRPEQQNFQNDANFIGDKRNAFGEYISVTKSETGELSGNNKLSHAYYTKSSTCGYFTFTCNYIDGSNGKSKICKPGPLTYSDGTPC